MEIESLRLDFLTLIIRINIKQKPTTYQSISEKEEKKKKSRTTQVARGPRQRETQAVATAEEFWRFCFLSFAFFYLAFCLAAQKIIKFGSLCLLNKGKQKKKKV